MNRANYHNLTKLADRRYQLLSTHPGTYLTTRMIVYTDPREFGLHEADLMEAIRKRHQLDVRSVCSRLSSYSHVSPSSQPLELFREMSRRPLIDWADHIPNPEEFMTMVADLRLLDEMVHDRVNYEVEVDTAHNMD